MSQLFTLKAILLAFYRPYPVDIKTWGAGGRQYIVSRLGNNCSPQCWMFRYAFDIDGIYVDSIEMTRKLKN